MKYFLISVEFYDYGEMNHHTSTYSTEEVFVSKKAIKEKITNGNEFFLIFIKEITEEEYNCFIK